MQRISGILGMIIILAMLIIAIGLGCRSEKEGGGISQYQDQEQK